MSDGNPERASERPSDDEMTGHDADEPSPDEVERGRDALRELGVEPLPVRRPGAPRGRLEGELGRAAPVRRRRRRPRLAFALPGAGVALAAAIVVAVLATNDGGSRPPAQQSALSDACEGDTAEGAEGAAGGAQPTRARRRRRSRPRCGFRRSWATAWGI